MTAVRDPAALRDCMAFVRSQTRCGPLPLVPEIRLHLAADVVALWEHMSRRAGGAEVPVPFWACAWPGGVALARYVLDHPQTVAGRSVVDVTAGSGVVAVAAALAGAVDVTACDVDPYALAAVACNGAANGVAVRAQHRDGLGAGGAHDVVLIGDAFYDAAIAERAWGCVTRAHAAGATVLVGDRGRAHLPVDHLLAVASYDVPGTAAFEAAAVTATTVWAPA